jgi:heat shock protein HslJ
LQVGRIAATRMACDEAITVQESKYLQALQDAERFAIEGAELVVYCKDADKPLRFARKEP